jgi:hypothetical protein
MDERDVADLLELQDKYKDFFNYSESLPSSKQH